MVSQLSELEPGPDAFVVGGFVRDMLLGIEPVDLDLTVLGDALRIAEATAAALGGAVRAVHPDWRTAEIEAGNGLRVGLASARSESYPAPGAVPELQFGADLAADLERRDFTLNAIAVPIDGGPAWAPADTAAHLESRSLAVTYGASFRDDPSRILRGARYQVRCDLDWHPEAERARDQAIGSGVPGCIRPAVLRAEMDRTATEPDPGPVLELLGAWGFMARLKPALVWSPRQSERWRRAASDASAAERRSLLWLMLLEALDDESRTNFCLAAGLGSAGGAVMRGTAEWRRRLNAVLEDRRAHGRVHRSLRGLSPAERRYLASLDEGLSLGELLSGSPQSP